MSYNENYEYKKVKIFVPLSSLENNLKKDYRLYMVYLKNKKDTKRQEDLTLKSLSLCSNLTETITINETHRQYDHYTIDIDSIKRFQLFKNRSTFYSNYTLDLYLELQHMPEKFTCINIMTVHKKGTRTFRKFKNKNHKEVSEVYSEDFLISS